MSFMDERHISIGKAGRIIARRPQADVAISGSEIATVAARLRNDRFCANEGGWSQLPSIREGQADWGYIDSDPWLDLGGRPAGEQSPRRLGSYGLLTMLNT